MNAYELRTKELVQAVGTYRERFPLPIKSLQWEYQGGELWSAQLPYGRRAVIGPGEWHGYELSVGSKTIPHDEESDMFDTVEEAKDHMAFLVEYVIMLQLDIPLG